MNAEQAVAVRKAQLLVVRLGNEAYGIEILKIARVLNCEGIAKTGGAPEFLEGTIEVEGRVVPVIDIGKRLDTRSGEQGRRRIVILDLEQGRLGIIVDDFLEVLPSGASVLEQLPDDVVATGEQSSIGGVVRTESGVIMVISPKQILASHEREALHQYLDQVRQVARS